jgi:archaeal type IV pilus assembly protein PilA
VLIFVKFAKNDEAVSPVIGVILMVAITVILAAVIAAFVFGMAGNIQKTKVVSVTLSRSPAGVNAVYQGGQDAPSLQRIVWSVNGVYEGSEGTISYVLPVGRTYLIPGSTDAGVHIVGVGFFNDGSQQVISDTTV